MLGVIPKTLWSRQVEIDEKNRMFMASRSLLIRSSNTDRIYLIDNGCGDKFDKKMKSIYAIDYEHSNLPNSLESCGISPEDVTDLIFTHLHFDHAGGTTYRDGDGELHHRFPNAVYHVNEHQIETVKNPNARERASFLSENVDPILASDRLHSVPDRHEWEPGLRSIPAFGHTDGMQLPLIEAEETTIVHAADLVPTRHHLPLVWLMAFDMNAAQTLREKRPFLEEALENEWYLYMQHDPEVEVLTLTKNERGKFSMDRSLTLSNL